MPVTPIIKRSRAGIAVEGGGQPGHDRAHGARRDPGLHDVAVEQLGDEVLAQQADTPTNVLDLADVQPSSITSAMVANGNTIELFNGTTMIDHFALASSVGTAAVHWGSDGGSGSNIFLSV